MAAPQPKAVKAKKPISNAPSALQPPSPANTRQARTPNKDAWLRRNSGAEIISITINDLQPDSSAVDSRSGFETLCSYNWHTDVTPSIYVPGAPPKWTPEDLPVTLLEDEGGRYIDQNAHHVPTYPFEPMFQAMSVMNPSYDFSSVDFISNRNSLRNLLNFVNNRIWHSFRIDLNMVNETLFLTRREKFTKELAGRSGSGRGYGHNFETSFTVPEQGLEDSTSHHRIARYMLGDLDCVVRYEVDAWMADDTDEKAATSHINVQTMHKQGPNDLLANLERLSLGNNDNVPAEKSNMRGTKVVSRGTPVDPAKLVELKAKGKDPKMSDLVPQLWFGRIPYLTVGVHENGRFDKGNVTITKTADHFEKFEENQQVQLRKLVALIKILKKETVASDGRACVVVCESKVKPLRLNVYTSSIRRSVLPQKLINEYWRS